MFLKNQYSYPLVIPLSLSYLVVEICCVIVVLKVCVNFIQSYYSSDDKTRESLHAMIKIFYDNTLSDVRDYQIFKICEDFIVLYESHKKNIYIVMFVVMIVIVLLEIGLKNFCLTQSEILLNMTNQKIENIPSFYFAKNDFVEFVRDNIYTIPYDNTIAVIFAWKMVGIAVMLIFLLYYGYVKSKYTVIYIGISCVLSVIMHYYLNIVKKYNLDVNHPDLLLDSIKYFKNSHKKNILTYYIILHSLLIFIGCFVLFKFKEYDIASVIIIVYNILCLIFRLKAIFVNLTSGFYMEVIIRNLPLYDKADFNIHKIDAIVSNHSSIVANYNNHVVTLLRDVNFSMKRGQMNIIESGPLARGVILNYLMTQNYNNNNVFLLIDGKKYPINRIENLSSFCMVFDDTWDIQDMNNDYNDLLSDISNVKIKHINIIATAIRSGVTFIGLDESLFSEFTVEERKNVINWIDKNRSSEQSVLVVVQGNLFAIDRSVNADVYYIDDGELNLLK